MQCNISHLGSADCAVFCEHLVTIHPVFGLFQLRHGLCWHYFASRNILQAELQHRTVAWLWAEAGICVCGNLAGAVQVCKLPPGPSQSSSNRMWSPVLWEMYTVPEVSVCISFLACATVTSCLNTAYHYYKSSLETQALPCSVVFGSRSWVMTTYGHHCLTHPSLLIISYCSALCYISSAALEFYSLKEFSHNHNLG